ncbi:YihY/virulence factor BrkB family protein [Penaeicola halotolerans]|uniref:YihY/virulence factor BrkB family protein n=1 Tax=Penaeicola halotolerans TaxID=2793196 RepID=UPI001CF9100B|nr:YihY/virulence factor BrkB family protein [Penaeicola halotolerans]
MALIEALKSFYEAQKDRLIHYLSKIHFGDPEANLYVLINMFLDQLKNDEISERASSVAYSFTVATFPALLFMINLVPFVQEFYPEINTQAIMQYLDDVMPYSLYENIAPTVEDIITKPRQGLLSFGFVAALVLATNGVLALMHAFNAVYKTSDKRGFLRTRMVATGLLFVLVFCFLAAIALLIVGQQVLDYLVQINVFRESFTYYLILVLRTLSLVLLFQMTISFIFRYAPAIHDKWKFFSIGSVLASLLCTLASFGFAIYINNFSSYNKLYGSIGAMLAFMFWLFIMSLVLLICFEINVTIDKVKKGYLKELNEKRLSRQVEKK